MGRLFCKVWSRWLCAIVMLSAEACAPRQTPVLTSKDMFLDQVALELLQPSGANAVDVNGKTYDLVVVGGTPGGIACAVRGAREGMNVLLVSPMKHLGGFLTS